MALPKFENEIYITWDPERFSSSLLPQNCEKLGGGLSPAFCRSLHQIGQCSSGKMRHNAGEPP